MDIHGYPRIQPYSPDTLTRCGRGAPQERPPLASPGRPRARAVHASHPAAAAPPRRVALAPGRGRKATIELLRTQGHKGVKWKRGVQGGAWAVQGGGKVRDPCMGRAGWLGRAQGWVGGSFGAPRFDHGLLAPSSQTKKRKVTSTPEVPGPSRSWSPAPAAPSSPLDLRTHLHAGWSAGHAPCGDVSSETSLGGGTISRG